ncbi:MAG TPA: RHS repeat-associated core domain-containing protein [Gemmatimonadaceae bacterium]|jgi:RHS repeat-associated protein
MLARAVSLAALTRGLAVLSLGGAVAVVHREAFSRTPPPLGSDGSSHSAVVTGPTIALAATAPATAILRDECVTASAGDDAAFECADLRLVHALPSTTTMAKRRTPTLIYNSRHENGITVFPVDVTLQIGTTSDLNAKVILSTATGSVVAQSSLANWSGWFPPMVRRINIPVNTAGLSTGVYQYKVVVDFNMTSGTLVEKTVSSTIAIVNRAQSAFGKGWWLDGLEQLVAYDNTHKLWVGGDGSTRLYTQSGTTSNWIVTPAIDRPDTLQQVSTSVWRRHLRNGAYVQFDNTGRHTQTVNRLGHTTTFVYANASHPTWLTGIQLPIPPSSPNAANPPAYRFNYGTSSVSSIDAPANGAQTRRVSLTQSPTGTGMTTTVTDPDGHTVKFDEQPGVGIVARTDQRGFVTTFNYDFVGGTLTRAHRDMQDATVDDVNFDFNAAERIGLAGSNAADTTQAVVMVGDPRYLLPSANRFGVGRFGAVQWVRNMIGEQTTLRRGDSRFPLAVTSVTRPNGFTNAATYTARGLLATVTDSQPFAPYNTLNATTRYRWSTGKYDVLTSVVRPTGDSTIFAYLANGDRQWEQLGSSQTRRVQYRYGSSRQLSAVASPGNNPVTEVDSVEYDRTLGNVSRTLTPRRVATRYHTDAIGRVDSVFSPGASNAQRIGVTTYDAMDRATLELDIGATSTYTLGASLLSVPLHDAAPAATTHVEHYYDGVGNDTLVQRWGTPNPTNIPLRQIYTHFDGVSRKTWELGANGGVRQWGYDAASNVVATITPRRDTIRLEYDGLNRLTRKVTPAVQYAPMTMSDGVTAFIWASFPNFGDNYSHDWHNRSEGAPPPLVIPGDTTVFSYDDINGLNTAFNHDVFIYRYLHANGTVQGESQNLRLVSPVVSGWPYLHQFGVSHLVDAGGRLTQRNINAPGNCGDQSCTQSYAYNSDTGELATIVADGDAAYVSLANQPEIRRTTVNVFGAGQSVSQVVDRDADGRATSRSATQGGTSIFTDMLSYDDANRVVSSATDYTFDVQRSTRVENAYTSLGALTANVRQHNGILSSDQYQTDAFANISTHAARNLTDGRGAVTTNVTYIAGDRQDGSAMTVAPVRPENPPTSIIEHTDATTFDAAGNRVFYRKSLKQFDRGRLQYVDANYGEEWNWTAYDAEDRLRVTQRSFFKDSVTLRTVFIEYSYDPYGRRVQIRTRWDMYCEPNPEGECHPSIERVIWDGNQIMQEMRGGGYATITDPADTIPRLPTCAPDQVQDGANPTCYPVGDPRATPIEPPKYFQTNVDAGGTPGPFEGVVRYVHAGGIDEPVVVYKSNLGTFVPLRSERGLVEDGVFLGDPLEGVSWPARDVDAFGARDVNVANPIVPTHWLGSLIGDRRDAAGLVYMRNRYYDPSGGRFTQEDPIGIAGGMNLYGYAGGDPINYTDPLGLCPAVFMFAGPAVGGATAVWCGAEVVALGASAAFAWFNKSRTSGETSAAAGGREAHRAWDPGSGFQKEVRLPSGKRCDALNPQTCEIKELKPDNERAKKRGEKQVEDYKKELDEVTGKDHKTKVETYTRKQP